MAIYTVVHCFGHCFLGDVEGDEGRFLLFSKEVEMKLDVNAQEFSDAYQAAFSAVGSRVSLFKLCLLECSDKCQVTGRSPVHAATVTVPDVTIQEHGEIMLPEVFGDLLSAVGDADMRIEQEGDCLSVTGDKFSYALQTMGVPDGFRRWAESGSVKAGEFTIP